MKGEVRMDWINKLVQAAEECIAAWLQNDRLDVGEDLRTRAGKLGIDKNDIERFVLEARELVEAEGAVRRIGSTAKAELSKEEIEELRKLRDPRYRDIPSEARDFVPPLRYQWTSMLGGDARTFFDEPVARRDEENNRDDDIG
jgi:hypothetical protein